MNIKDSNTTLLTPDAAQKYNSFQLSDGRVLAFTEFGDSDGFPVFYFHGTPSSRLEGVFADAAAKKHAMRLIAIDRPGFGHSDFQPHRTFSDWPKDILALADYLQLKRFGVVGHSGAGPHLFACGAYIDSSRLVCIGALGPWAPVASLDIVEELNTLDAFYLRMARNMPWLMHIVFAPVGWGVRYAPRLFWYIMKASVSRADKEKLAQKTFLETFQEIEREAFRHGGRGAAHEAAIAYQPWDFSLEDVRAPTYMWLGTDDIFVSQSMGRYLERHIPDASLHLLPDKGHFAIESWDDILKACAQHM